MKFVERSIGMQCLHESLCITVIVNWKVNCKAFENCCGSDQNVKSFAVQSEVDTAQFEVRETRVIDNATNDKVCFVRRAIAKIQAKRLNHLVSLQDRAEGRFAVDNWNSQDLEILL
jgi:hypothetical protein